MSGRIRVAVLFIVAAVVLSGCQSLPRDAIGTVPNLDLERFMGDWYVIANIPTFIEKTAHNAVETYELSDDRTVATTFRFRDGAFDGPEKVYRPTGFISEESNAVWGMQFIWPIKAEYLVMYVDDAYERTIIARNKRDYVWLMARKSVLTDSEYAEMIDQVEAAGYDISRIVKVPQKWPDA